MIVPLRSCRTLNFEKRAADDRLSDLARVDRPDRDRIMGGIFVAADLDIVLVMFQIFRRSLTESGRPKRAMICQSCALNRKTGFAK